MNSPWKRRLSALVLFSTLVGSVSAADLPSYQSPSGSYCSNHRQSVLPQRQVSEIRQTVSQNLASAIDGMNSQSVLRDSDPAFIWAMEARWACAAAVGYLNGGTVDVESVQKCDCFHQRYLSFR